MAGRAVAARAPSDRRNARCPSQPDPVPHSLLPVRVGCGDPARTLGNVSQGSQSPEYAGQYTLRCARCVCVGHGLAWHFRSGRGSAVHQRHGRAARGVAGGERGRHRHAGEAGGGRVEGRAAAHRGHHQHQPGRRAVDGGAALGVPRALRSDFSDDSPGGRGGPAALRRDLRRRRVGAARRRAARTEPAGRQCQRHRCHAALAGRSVGPPARSLNRPPSHRGSVDIEWFRAPTGAARTARAPQHPLPSGRAVPLPPCRRRPYP